jgi:hypothetical protein
MKNIKNFGEFITEALSQEEINKRIRSEKLFVNKLTDLSLNMLTDFEKKGFHFVHEFILNTLYRIYDGQYEEKANSIGLDDNDYQSALNRLNQSIIEFRQDKKYKKLEGELLTKIAKAKAKADKLEARFKEQELGKGRPYTAPTETELDMDDDDDED